MNKFNQEYSKFESRAIRQMYFDNTQKEINEALKEKETNNKAQTSRKLKKGRALLTAFVISAAGWIGVGHVKEYKYQKDIDKYNENMLMLVPSDDLNMTKDDRDDATQYLTAVFEYQDNDISDEEKSNYENIIDGYVASGKAIKLEEQILTKKLDLAKKVSSYKAIDKKYDTQKTTLSFYDEPGDPDGFHISGVQGEAYPIEGWHIISNDVPDNLIKSAKDCMKYKNYDWGTMEKDERVEVGVKIGKHTETLLNEHYIINKKGIKRINSEDYQDLLEDYKKEDAKKTREREEKARKSVEDMIK